MSVTDLLLSKYDQKFNDSYNKIVNINSSIKNKEELILQQNDEIQNKDNTITILKYTIYLVLILGILLILNLLNKITSNILLISGIVLFIGYLILIYFSIYRSYNQTNMNSTLQKLKVDMDQYVYDITGNVSQYTCPNDCTAISDEEPNPSMIQTKQTPILNIDRQLNVWKYGDVPEDGYTSDKLPGSTFYTSPSNIPNYNVTDEENQYNSPQSYFGTTYPRTTYYECKWLGGNTNGGLSDSTEQYSTVPCSYRENTEEINRYICTQDPNTSGLDNCTNISYL